MRYQGYKKGKKHNTFVGKGFAIGSIFPKKQPLRKGILTDTDGDGYMNPVDCEPFDPNKQGRVGDWVKEKKEKIQEWREKAPERREARHEEKLKRLDYRQKELERKAELQKTRQQIDESRYASQKQRLGLQEQRTNLQERRQKVFDSRMQTMPSIGFGMGFSQQEEQSRPVKQEPMPKLSEVWGFSQPTPIAPTTTKTRKKPKKRKTKKTKSRKKKGKR